MMLDVPRKAKGPKASTRVDEDFYPTPAFMVDDLMDDLPFEEYTSQAVLEPCVGTGVIVRAIQRRAPRSHFRTNDISRRFEADDHADAAKDAYWRSESGLWAPDWVITNPPFNVAIHIVTRALETIRQSPGLCRGVAMLLRISWAEPVEERAVFLEDHPPTRLIIEPRWSFKRNGKADSATCAWFIWSDSVAPGVRIARRRGRGQERLDMSAEASG